MGVRTWVRGLGLGAEEGSKGLGKCGGEERRKDHLVTLKKREKKCL